MHRQPLEGVTVLDFGQVYYGPYCGFLLAQAGARVIKVESLVGETLRARGARSPASYPFAILNTNKECITLNIKSAEGQALLKRLAGAVDVVFENFAPGTMDKYGIGADALRAVNPRLIYGSSTGYGAGGPGGRGVRALCPRHEGQLRHRRGPLACRQAAAHSRLEHGLWTGRALSRLSRHGYHPARHDRRHEHNG